MVELYSLQGKLMNITCDFSVTGDGKVNADNDYHPTDPR